MAKQELIEKQCQESKERNCENNVSFWSWFEGVRSGPSLAKTTQSKQGCQVVRFDVLASQIGLSVHLSTSV